MAITLKNVSSTNVWLEVPSMRLSRELIPGRKIAITQENYEDLTADPGIIALLRGHYIAFEGLDENEVVEEVGKVFDHKQIEEMLVKGDITAFAKFIPNATSAEKESAVKYAIAHKITNNAIVALIKKYCDVDIINAINVAHDAEEK